MRKRGPLMITSWRATRACNLNCRYCNVNANMEPAPDELNTNEALHLVDEIYEFGSEWMGIKGGEPLLRRDIFEVIGYAKSVGLKVCLLTNGYFVEGEIYDNLVNNEVYTSVSLDGSEKTNDVLRGKGTYRKALSAVQKLSKAGILNGISVAITTINYKDLDHVVALAEEYGAKFVWFNHEVPVGRAKERFHLDPSPEQYEWALNHIYDLTQKFEGRVRFRIHCPFYARVVKERAPSKFWEWYNHEFSGKCIYFLFGGYLSIVENGDVIPCFYTENLRIGNVKEKSLKELWDKMQGSDFYKRLKDPNNLKGKCGMCEYREICGGCRTRAYSYTGDFFGSDLACAHIPKQIRE